MTKEIRIENETEHAASMEQEECPECGLALKYCDNHWAPNTIRRSWIGCPNTKPEEDD